MSVTYILQLEGPEKLVKFGRTRNPTSRISTLRTGLPWPLRIVALIGADIETALKRQFVADKVRGEWFRPSQALCDWLEEAAGDGRLVKQVPVDQAYINAVIKPRLREYLNGREPENNHAGDLVRCLFADLLPTIAGRERAISLATKGQISEALCYGFGPTNDVPVLHLSEAAVTAEPTQAAA